MPRMTFLGRNPREEAAKIPTLRCAPRRLSDLGVVGRSEVRAGLPVQAQADVP